MTLAEKIAAALRASMSRPGYGYIDFTWHVGVDVCGKPYGPYPREDEELVALAEDIAAHWPDSDAAE